MKIIHSHDGSNRETVFYNKIISSDKNGFPPKKERNIIQSIYKDPGLPEHQWSPATKFFKIFQFVINRFLRYFPLALFSKLPST